MSDHLKEFKDVMEKAHEPQDLPIFETPLEVLADQDNLCFEIYDRNRDRVASDIEQLEQAKMFAAAPEMYSELEDLLNALENLPQFMPGVDFPAVFDKKIELRKLLRKARGESDVEK